MEGHCLALPIEHLGESVLLLLHLFRQSSLCPYQVMEAAVFLLLLLMMMDFRHIDLQLRRHLKTSSYIGEFYDCCTVKNNNNHHLIKFIEFPYVSHLLFLEVIYYFLAFQIAYRLFKIRMLWDITIFRNSLRCHAHGCFEGISFSDMQRWVALRH